ncbi:MAG: hypothetical protein D6807_04110 [Alphaproteobacteria bacterium]|nr:MAG: hypothetical protein D6807_04110 [Alphaproteobacteria bacterium]
MTPLAWRWLRRLAALVIGGVVIATSLLPLSALPASDKLLHLLAYGLWAVPVSVSRRHIGRIGVYLVIILAAGGLVEIVQPYVGREASLADFFANMAGIVLGGTGGLGLRHWRLRRDTLSRKQRGLKGEVGTRPTG